MSRHRITINGRGSCTAVRHRSGWVLAFYNRHHQNYIVVTKPSCSMQMLSPTIEAALERDTDPATLDYHTLCIYRTLADARLAAGSERLRHWF